MTLRSASRLAVILLVAPLAVFACSDSTSDVGAGDGGGGDAGHESAAPDAAECCKPDPRPGCCMSYGGWRNGGVCRVRCDGMPDRSDPGWKLEMDSHGCERWTNPNDVWNGGTPNAATSYCGMVPGRDAGSDAADAATD
jgi:hypothetical protein